jgi:diaminopimelate epimerase
MCGNGGRCIVAFAKKLHIINDKAHFLAIDGPHHAHINEQGDWVDLQMIDVKQIKQGKNYFILNTGSPHYVTFVKDFDQINVYEEGRQIRNSEPFAQEGINVNFVAQEGALIKVATYERGVEAETLSCGTGVTAAAIASWITQGDLAKRSIDIQTKGGNLKVLLEPNDTHGFQNIWLCGPATFVFDGNVEIDTTNKQ